MKFFDIRKLTVILDTKENNESSHEVLNGYWRGEDASSRINAILVINDFLGCFISILDGRSVL